LAWEEVGAKIGKMEGGGEANRSASQLASWQNGLISARVRWTGQSLVPGLDLHVRAAPHEGLFFRLRVHLS